jgi:hypothetical protein
MLIENFGGFLNTAKKIISGDKESAQMGSDVPADLYSAEAIRNMIITTANKVDNIIGMANEKDRAAAKSSAGEIIAFLRESFVKLEEIIKEQGKGDMTGNERSSTLSKISSQLDIINRSGGVIDKWKTEFLGKGGSKIAGSALFDKGKSLVEKARSIMKVIEDTKAIKDKIKSTEFDQIIKRSIEAASGTDMRGFKPKQDVFTTDSNNNPEVVQRYRERLKKIGVDTNQEGKYTASDKPSTSQAMQYIGTVTGKTYGYGDEALADFQKDLGAYTDNQDDIKKLFK